MNKLEVMLFDDYSSSSNALPERPGLSRRAGGETHFKKMERVSSPREQTNPPTPKSSVSLGSSLTRIGLLSLALTGCASSPPAVVPEIIRQPIYIPVSATLTAPIQVTLLPGVTYGEALGRLNAGLQTCNSQLGAIHQLVPPNPP